MVSTLKITKQNQLKLSNFQKSIGNGYHLANQEQNICIRREKDYCEICYSTVTNKDFGVSAGGGGFNDGISGQNPMTFTNNYGYFRNQGMLASQILRWSTIEDE